MAVAEIAIRFVSEIVRSFPEIVLRHFLIDVDDLYGPSLRLAEDWAPGRQRCGAPKARRLFPTFGSESISACRPAGMIGSIIHSYSVTVVPHSVG